MSELFISFMDANDFYRVYIGSMSVQKFVLRVMNTNNTQEYPVDDNLFPRPRAEIAKKILEYIQTFNLDPECELEIVGDRDIVIRYRKGNVRIHDPYL